MLTGRPNAFTINAFFEINDPQMRIIGTDDLLKIELVNDRLEKCDEAWVNILNHWRRTRRLSSGRLASSTVGDKSTSLQNALAQNSDQSHAKSRRASWS